MCQAPGRRGKHQKSITKLKIDTPRSCRLHVLDFSQQAFGSVHSLTTCVILLTAHAGTLLFDCVEQLRSVVFLIHCFLCSLLFAHIYVVYITYIYNYICIYEMDRSTMIFSVNHCTPPAKETLQIEGFDRHYPSLHYLLGLYPCQADKEVAHGCAGVAVIKETHQAHTLNFYVQPICFR